MVRLVKGAKETFGWVVVGEKREVMIPPEAWQRYGFQAGEEAIILLGSKTSGGFAITNQKLLAKTSFPKENRRVIGHCIFLPNKAVCIPNEIPVFPGQKLFTVFGSGYALGFITRGPIYTEALQHPELQVR